MRCWITLIALGILASPRRAAADEVHELKYDVAIDATVAITATIITVGSELAKGDLAPSPCNWCDPPGIDVATRDALKWDSTKTAAAFSDAMGFAVAPASAFGTLGIASVDAGAGKNFGVDALLLYETLSVSAVVNQVVKLSVGRERPFVHALSPDEKAKVKHPSDNNLSFYSGHTGLTMTMAAAGGTLASLRGYRLAPLVWGTGIGISAFTGYLRIAADKHWLTDVLTGAVVGAAVGTVWPLVFHGRRDDVVTGAVAPSTPAVASFGGTF